MAGKTEGDCACGVLGTRAGTLTEGRARGSRHAGGVASTDGGGIRREGEVKL